MAKALKKIVEVAETRSRHKKSGIAKSTSLDLLFKQLKKETKCKEATVEDEFSKTKAQLDRLPKIESDLESRLNAIRETTQLETVVKIDDPIIHTTTKNVDKDADSGSKWFNMKRRDLTPELKRDLMIIKNRSILDRKRHYKKEKWVIPKYFQTGTIIEGNTEFYSARLSRKNRGKTLAAEILNDDDSSKYFKRKYHEIQKEKTSGGKKHYKKVKEKRKGF